MAIDRRDFLRGALICATIAISTLLLPKLIINHDHQSPSQKNAIEEKFRAVMGMPKETPLSSAEALSVKNEITGYLSAMNEQVPTAVMDGTPFAYKQVDENSMLIRFVDTAKGMICPVKQVGTRIDRLPAGDVVLFEITNKEETNWVAYQEKGVRRIDIAADGKGKKTEYPVINGLISGATRSLCDKTIETINAKNQINRTVLSK